MKKTELEREALSRLTAASAAWLCGMSNSGFRAADPPAPRNQDRTYDAQAVVEWHLSRKLASLPTDPLLLSGGDSPSLERYRLSRAKLSELEYSLKCRSVVPLDEMRGVVVQLGHHIRHIGEQLARRYGPAAQTLLNGSLQEFDAMHEKAFDALSRTGAPAGDEPDARNPGDPEADEDENQNDD